MRSSAKPTNDEGEEVYHVEVITKARVVAATDSSSAEENGGPVSDLRRKKRRGTPQAKWEYYVKWAGYDSDADSWEPEENVAGCQRLLTSFWEHIGVDNKDYEVGYVARADEQWIKREKKFFTKEYTKEQTRKQGREHKTKKTRKSGTIVSRSPATSSAKGKGKAVEIELTSSSDSGDDMPLSQVIPSKRKAIQVTSSGEESPTYASSSKVQKTSSTTRKVTVRDPVQDPIAESLFTPSPVEISDPKPLPPGKVQPIPLPLPPKRPQVATKPSRRRYNQHDDIAAGTLNIASNSALATKQRLAKLLNPVAPRSPTTPTLSPGGFDKAKLPSAASTKHTLSSLSFKKGASAVQSPPTSFSLPDRIAGTSIQNTVTPSGIVGTTWETSALVQEKRDQRLESSRNATDMEVDTFLQSVMPQELAAPLTASPETDRGPVPPKSLLSRKLPPPTKIPKKWKWSGPLILQNSGGQTENINVTIQDCTEPIGNGLRFSVVMTGIEQLVAPSFHDFVDISPFLRACQPPSQHGRITTQDDGDVTSILTLSLFMGRSKQVILIPAALDGGIVAWLLLFSPDSELCRKLNVPSDLRQSHSLVVSLVPWELSARQHALDWRKPISDILPRTISIERTIDESGRWERSIRTKGSYHHALRVLGFPRTLHDFMAQDKRPFCVWWDGGDNTNSTLPGIETMYLWSIMEQCRAGNVGLKSIARVVFIHVGALRTVHKMPQFVDRRANHPLVQFYTYGTHESVAPSVWGIREIWPCGGVITFMPQAALDDFPDLLHRIRQTSSHPLWTCYVIPSVVGMIARMICRSDDPLAVFDRGEFLFPELLTAIAEGDLAMLTAPRSESHSTSATELRQQWIDEYVLSQPDSEREILQYAVASFNSRYSNIQPSDWMRVTAEELSVDLSHMQRQPAFMRDYRRYVVLHGNRQEISLPDGFEWVTTSDFDFRDDFFPRQ